MVVSPTFSLVFVCTGNRFRSPLAAALVARLVEGEPITTESFGTLDVEGLPALPEAVELGRAMGIDLSPHRARPVLRANLRNVDLLLGFEDAHVRESVVDAGAPRERAFTLRHFMRLLHEVSPSDDAAPAVERARELVARADAVRATQRSTLADNMRDPLGAPAKVQHEIAAEIRDSCLELAARLFNVRGRTLPTLQAPSRRLSWFR